MWNFPLKNILISAHMPLSNLVTWPDLLTLFHYCVAFIIPALQQHVFSHSDGPNTIQTKWFSVELPFSRVQETIVEGTKAVA